MNGPEHYAEGERLLSEATKTLQRAYDTASGAYVPREWLDSASLLVAQAQVHATLALAAATALTGSDELDATPEWNAWFEVAGVRIRTGAPT